MVTATDRSRAGTLLASVGNLGVDLRPLTVIVAPSGWGKTELLESWIAELPAGTPFYRPERDRADWSDALEQWAERLEEPGVAALDDYQDITSAAADTALLRTLQANPHLHLILSGRRFDVLDTPVATLRVDTTVLTRADLGLTEEDVALMLADAQISPSAYMRRALSRADGWERAVQEIVESFSGNSDDAARDRLHTAMHEALSPNASLKVLRLILLTRGTSMAVLSQASELSEAELEQAVISLLEGGLVEERWSGHDLWYTAHPLLLGIPSLVGEKGVLDDEERLALNLESASLASMDPVQALLLLADHGMLEEAGKLGQRYFLPLSDSLRTLKTVFSQVTEEEFAANQALAQLRLFLCFNDPDTSPTALRRWAKGLRERTENEQKVGSPQLGLEDLATSLVTDLVLGSWERVPTASRYLEEALAHHSQTTKWGARTTAPLLYSLLASAGLLTGDQKLAERAATQSRNVARVEANLGAQAEASNTLALIAALQGRGREAHRHLLAAAALTEDPSVKVKGSSKADAGVAEAVLLFGEGKPEEAQAKLAEVEPMLGRGAGLEAYMILGTWVTRLLQGNRAAFNWLRTQLTERSTDWISPKVQSDLVATATDLLIYEGELRLAKELLATAPKVTDQVLLSEARLHCARGKSGQVPQILLNLDRPDASTAVAATAKLFEAAALASEDNVAEALKVLDTVVLSSSDTAATTMLSSIPYQPLLTLGEAAAKAGHPRLLRLVEALPRAYRFETLVPLTSTELEVLQQLSQKKTNREVAEARGVSVNTVKAQTRGIYRKLNVSSRVDMVRVAREKCLT